MMTKTIDIQEFKDKKLDELQQKKFDKIAEELSAVILLTEVSIRGFNLFSKYVQVMEIISCLQNSKTLLEIKLAKYQKIKNNDKENTLEKTEE